MKICLNCKGKGSVGLREPGTFIDLPCHVCDGEGFIISEEDIRHESNRSVTDKKLREDEGC